MKIIKLSSALAIAASTVLMSAGTSAHASGDAILNNTASITNFGFRLVDLDLNDGVAPTVAFTNVFSETFSQACECGGGVFDGANYTYEYPSNIDTSSVYDNSETRSSISPLQYVTSGFLTGLGYFRSIALTSMDFKLSANTKLVFFGTASASVTGGYDDHNPGYYNGAGVNMAIENNSYGRFISSLQSGATNSFTENFEVEYANNLARAFDGHADIGTGASAHVSEVPEPTSYLMLGAGLLLIGGVARRRAQRS